ncbi:hypothetical protein QC762_310460 [Podospora pseudocomata]|uniref:Uncharacterized protein n=1 Tax=Podospora pseudocomata TaxID=2093779 RepID=A0ABR0GKQ3_9PEZI|nr:hypothetical protein QC762_310460 [Podospora pseudocomata]
MMPDQFKAVQQRLAGLVQMVAPDLQELRQEVEELTKALAAEEEASDINRKMYITQRVALNWELQQRTSEITNLHERQLKLSQELAACQQKIACSSTTHAEQIAAIEKDYDEQISTINSLHQREISDLQLRHQLSRHRDAVNAMHNADLLQTQLAWERLKVGDLRRDCAKLEEECAQSKEERDQSRKDCESWKTKYDESMKSNEQLQKRFRWETATVDSLCKNCIMLQEQGDEWKKKHNQMKEEHGELQDKHQNLEESDLALKSRYHAQSAELNVALERNHSLEEEVQQMKEQLKEEDRRATEAESQKLFFLAKLQSLQNDHAEQKEMYLKRRQAYKELLVLHVRFHGDHHKQSKVVKALRYDIKGLENIQKRLIEELEDMKDDCRKRRQECEDMMFSHNVLAARNDELLVQCVELQTKCEKLDDEVTGAQGFEIIGSPVESYDDEESDEESEEEEGDEESEEEEGGEESGEEDKEEDDDFDEVDDQLSDLDGLVEVEDQVSDDDCEFPDEDK